VSYLSYEGLLQAITDTNLDPALRMQVEPFHPERLRSCSLELHVGSSYARWRHSATYAQHLGPRALRDINDQDYEVITGLGPGDRIVISPGESWLLAVDCWVALGAGLLAQVHGKSSVARAGQQIHTAGLVEPGFVGVLTLEPVNFAPFPVIYEVGQAVAQMTVSLLDQPTKRPYGHPQMGSRYQGQSQVTPPRRFAPGDAWSSPPRIPTNT
jgi:dCTP deaminase